MLRNVENNEDRCCQNKQLRVLTVAAAVSTLVGTPGPGTHPTPRAVPWETPMRMRRRHALVAGCTVAAAALATVAAIPGADAAITASTLVNSASGKCLDVNGNSNADGVVVQLWGCNGGANQRWTTTGAGELQVTIAGVTKCLDASGGGTANGTRLIMWSCHG